MHFAFSFAFVNFKDVIKNMLLLNLYIRYDYSDLSLFSGGRKFAFPPPSPFPPLLPP